LASSGGHVPILVHWGVNCHTVDKSGGLSVIIPIFLRNLIEVILSLSNIYIMICMCASS
jgi:hypothetical protein